MKKQNNWWLVSLWTFILAGILDNVLLFSILLKNGLLETGLQIAVTLGFLGMGVMLKLFFGRFTYYCAYQKRGTKWLTFLLFALPIIFLKSLSNIKPDPNYKSHLLSLLLLLTLSLYIWFWLACYRLRQNNIRLGSHLAKSIYSEQGLINKIRELITMR